ACLPVSLEAFRVHAGLGQLPLALDEVALQLLGLLAGTRDLALQVLQLLLELEVPLLETNHFPALSFRAGLLPRLRFRLLQVLAGCRVGRQRQSERGLHGLAAARGGGQEQLLPTAAVAQARRLLFGI